MKISGSPAVLAKGFASAAAVAPQMATRPVLENVLVKAEAEGLTLTATDLEIGLQLKVPEVEIQEPGTLLLPAAKTAQILKECREEQVSLVVEKGQAVLRSGRNTFQLSSREDPADFPDLRLAEEKPDLEMEMPVLKEMIRKTIFAAAREGLQYALHGVLLAGGKGQLELVALDGKKLARIIRPVKGAKAGQKALVPTRGMSQLEKLLGDDQGKVQLNFSDKRLVARTETAALIATLIDGRFPDYEKIIPSAWARTAVVEAPDFLGAVRRAAVLADKNTRMVECRFAEEKLVLTAREEGGQSEVELDAEYKDPPLTIAFSSDVLTEVLRATGSGKVTIKLGEDDSTFARVDAGNQLVYVLAPLQRPESG